MECRICLRDDKRIIKKRGVCITCYGRLRAQARKRVGVCRECPNPVSEKSKQHCETHRLRANAIVLKNYYSKKRSK